MSCHLHDLVFRQLVPESIRSDSQMAAAADAISPFLQTIVRAVPNLLIYGRLEEQDPAGMLAPLRRLTEARGGLKDLSTEELEQLAWQWHVDFRDAAKTNEQLRAFVLDSIPWHRIKGTPEAMRRALALHGYTAEIEEDGEGEHWAAYQLHFEDIPTAADLIKISAICADVEPARCRLWRVYVPEYDLRPFSVVWRPWHVPQRQSPRLVGRALVGLHRQGAGRHFRGVGWPGSDRLFWAQALPALGAFRRG